MMRAQAETTTVVEVEVEVVVRVVVEVEVVVNAVHFPVEQYASCPFRKQSVPSGKLGPTKQMSLKQKPA